MKRQKQVPGKEQFNETAYRKLKALIINLTLPPSSKINEKEMEDKLKIGRTPLREALQRLNNEGLVDYIPRKGYLVRPITIGDIKDIFEFMYYFERTAVYLACTRITSLQINDLNLAFKSHREAIEKEDYLAVSLQNARFHHTIYQASGNAYIYQALTNMHSQSQRLAYLCFINEHPSPERDEYNIKSIRDHEEIIQCLVTGNAKKAVDITTRHIDQFSIRIYHYFNPGSAGADSLNLIIPELDSSPRQGQ